MLQTYLNPSLFTNSQTHATPDQAKTSIIRISNSLNWTTEPRDAHDTGSPQQHQTQSVSNNQEDPFFQATFGGHGPRVNRRINYPPGACRPRPARQAPASARVTLESRWPATRSDVYVKVIVLFKDT